MVMSHILRKLVVDFCRWDGCDPLVPNPNAAVTPQDLLGIRSNALCTSQLRQSYPAQLRLLDPECFWADAFRIPGGPILLPTSATSARGIFGLHTTSCSSMPKATRMVAQFLTC